MKMKKQTYVFARTIVVLLWCVARPEATTAAEISLVPVSASGRHSVVGNTIWLARGPQTVTLEVRIADWSPDQLAAFQADLDASGLVDGQSGSLSFPLLECTSDSDCLGDGGDWCLDWGTAKYCLGVLVHRYLGDEKDGFFARMTPNQATLDRKKRPALRIWSAS